MEGIANSNKLIIFFKHQITKC